MSSGVLIPLSAALECSVLLNHLKCLLKTGFWAGGVAQCSALSAQRLPNMHKALGGAVEGRKFVKSYPRLSHSVCLKWGLRKCFLYTFQIK